MDTLLTAFITAALLMPLLFSFLNWWDRRKLEQLITKGRQESEQRQKELREMCVEGLLKKAEIHFCSDCQKQMTDFLEQARNEKVC